MKKKFFLLLTSLIYISTSVFAENNEDFPIFAENNGDSTVFAENTDDQKVNMTRPCLKFENMFGEKPGLVVTPSAYPLSMTKYDVFVTASFIYWTAREDGLAYATNEVMPPNTGKVHLPDWEINPGFKVGFGTTVNHDGWDVYAQYTWLRPNSSTKAKPTADSISSQLVPSWGIFDLNPSNVVLAANRWALDFDVIDLDLGRHYFISHFLTLKPFFGLKGTWQKQKYDVVYTRENGEFGELKFKQDNWGLGVRTGLDTTWHIIKNFSLFGNFALTALWENFDVLRSDSNRNGLQLKLRQRLFGVKSVLESIVGFRWDQWFSKDQHQYHFSLDAGWELQVWIEQNQFFTLTSTPGLGPTFTGGDLSFQGLTLKARFDF